MSAPLAAQRLRAHRKTQGLCVRCGAIAIAQRTLCLPCQEKQSETSKRWWNRYPPKRLALAAKWAARRQARLGHQVVPCLPPTRSVLACCGQWHAITTVPLVVPCCGRTWLAREARQ